MNSMRILILTPSRFPGTTGNAITTERWRRSLTAAGAVVEVLSSSELESSEFAEHLRSFRPDVIHIHHAFRTAVLVLDPLIRPQIETLPLVVSPGGTDINLDIGMAERKETVLSVLNMARIILVQGGDTAQSVWRNLPDRSASIVHVAKAFSWFGNEDCELRKAANCSDKDVLFFLPAGIRPVKGNLECLAAMERVFETRPNVRFVNAGPAIDAAYAAKFERKVNELAAFARWIRAIPPAAMRSGYEASDVVVNASFSEGLSNSVLEALAAERPVLASDVPGNRQPLQGEDGPPAGLLFDPRNPDDFVAKAIALVDDDELRRRLAQAAGMRRNAIPTPEAEAAGLLAAYKAAMGS
ncbi:MAG: glycosyltransferase family 4 protein [Acidobacteria bacterium]|nr:glycosyltransferase family 4 protein [Acidobacteriota bacterium]